MLQFTMTPKRAKVACLKILSAGRVPYMRSSPGIGKSSIGRDIAKEHNLEYIDVRLSMRTPEDLLGLPMRSADGKYAEFIPFMKDFPLEGMELPAGKRGWLVNLDEFSSANKSVQAAAYQLVLDRQLGNHKLHKDVAMIACGNLESDKAIVVPMSTALQSRFVHIHLVIDNKEWIEWANSHKIDNRIIAFMHYRPELLHNFKPDHQDVTFSSPRTWEMASDIVKNEKDPREIADILAGTVGGGASAEFVAFCDEYDRIPSIRNIIADPEGTPKPPEASTRYATLYYLVEHTTHENVEPVVKYLTKFPNEEQLLYYKSLFVKQPKLRTLKVVYDQLGAMMKFLDS